MIQHTDPLVDLFKTIPAFKSQVWVTRVPQGTTPTFPYLLVHPSDGTDTQERVTGPRITQHPRWTLHTVGSSASQVAKAAADVKGKLIVNGRGVVLDVAGEKCSPCWYSSPIPIDVDTDVEPPIVWHTAECGFDSDPAPEGFVYTGDGLYTTDGLVETPPGSGLYAF